MRGSFVDCVHVAPPSSERKKPWSTIAYKRFAPVPGATATPILLRAFSGRPFVLTSVHVVPASLDLMISEVGSAPSLLLPQYTTANRVVVSVPSAHMSTMPRLASLM